MIVGLLMTSLVLAAIPANATTAYSDECRVNGNWDGAILTTSMKYDDSSYNGERLDIFWQLHNEETLSIEVVFYSENTDMMQAVDFIWTLNVSFARAVWEFNNVSFEIWSGDQKLETNNEYEYIVRLDEFIPPDPDEDTKTFHIEVFNISNPPHQVQMTWIEVIWTCEVKDVWGNVIGMLDGATFQFADLL